MRSSSNAVARSQALAYEASSRVLFQSLSIPPEVFQEMSLPDRRCLIPALEFMINGAASFPEADALLENRFLYVAEIPCRASDKMIINASVLATDILLRNFVTKLMEKYGEHSWFRNLVLEISGYVARDSGFGCGISKQLFEMMIEIGDDELMYASVDARTRKRFAPSRPLTPHNIEERRLEHKKWWSNMPDRRSAAVIFSVGTSGQAEGAPSLVAESYTPPFSTRFGDSSLDVVADPGILARRYFQSIANLPRSS